MKAGIVGLPSSGKSTLWCLLTETLEGPDPARAGKLQLKTVKVRDPRLERLWEDYRTKKCTPASIEIGDFPAVSLESRDRAGIAELLAPARTMEVLILALRGFEDAAAPGPIDPVADYDEIHAELLLGDLVIVERRVEKLRVQVKKPTPTQEQDRRELELLERVQGHLEEKGDLVDFPFADAERKMVQGYQFLGAKPMVVVVNRGDAPTDEAVIRSLAEKSGAPVFDVPCRNALEILQLPADEQVVFMKELGVVPGTREQILDACYRAAGRISFFTAGDKEVRAWTIRAGEHAVEAAAEVHTDMARGFIRAETVSYDDYVAHGGVKGAREKGLLRVEGKDYVVQDGDIIEFRFSV